MELRGRCLKQDMYFLFSPEHPGARPLKIVDDRDAVSGS